MAAILRLQFSQRPDPATLGAIIAAASMSPHFEDTDILEDQ